MRSFFKLAFALFKRVRTLTAYTFTIAALVIAYLGCVMLFAYVSGDAVGGSWRAMPTLMAVGSAMFAVGLYLYVAGGLVFKRSLSTMARYLDRVGDGDLALHFLPGWGNVSEGQ